MIDLKNIIPFTDFWMECSLNNFFTLLINSNIDFKQLAIMNYYSYNIRKISSNKYNRIFSSLEINYNDLYNIIYKYIKQKKIKTPKSKSLKATILEQIYNNIPVFLFVDLFYLINNSLFGNLIHGGHHTLITNFDKYKDLFIVFDDDMNGYNKFTITSSVILKAFRSGLNINKERKSKIENFLFTIEIIDNNPNIELYLNNIIKNADKIIDNLTNIIVLDFWENKGITNNIYLNTLFVRGVFTIINRQYANKTLIISLESENKIKCKEDFQLLINLIDTIIKGWNTIKYAFIKQRKLENDTFNLNYYKENARILMEKEISFWNKLKLCIAKSY